MKKITKIFVTLLLIILLLGCQKKEENKNTDTQKEVKEVKDITVTLVFNNNTKDYACKCDDGKFNCDIEEPEKEGYTFIGWYDNPNYLIGKKYYNADGSGVTTFDKPNNITLYAGYKEKDFLTGTELNKFKSDNNNNADNNFKIFTEIHNINNIPNFSAYSTKTLQNSPLEFYAELFQEYFIGNRNLFNSTAPSLYQALEKTLQYSY